MSKLQLEHKKGNNFDAVVRREARLVQLSFKPKVRASVCSKVRVSLFMCTTKVCVYLHASLPFTTQKILEIF